MLWTTKLILLGLGMHITTQTASACTSDEDWFEGKRWMCSTINHACNYSSN